MKHQISVRPPMQSLVKRAEMDKIIGTIKSYGQDAANVIKNQANQVSKNVMEYKPFDTASAYSAAPRTALYGALAGALLEGGRVGLSNMLRGRDRYDERDRRPSALLAALRGALIGGTIGGVAPLALPAAVPYIADYKKHINERDTLNKLRTSPETTDLPETIQNSVARGAGAGAHAAYTYGLPRKNVKELLDLYKGGKL